MRTGGRHAGLGGKREDTPMFCKESGIRWDGVVEKIEKFPFVGFELGFHRLMGQECLETDGKNQPQIIIKTNQPLIKRRIVEPVEADAIADVEAFRFVAAPREDVGGDEEFADGQTGEGATVGVVVEHDFAEVVLPAALFGGTRDFGFAGRRTRNLADAGAGDDFRGFFFSFRKEGVETFLTEGNEFGRVLVELVPYGAVEVAGSGQAADSA